MNSRSLLLLAWLGSDIFLSGFADADECKYALRPTAVFTARRDKAGSIALSPDGRTVACGDRDGAVYVWDVPARKLLHRLSVRMADSVRSRVLVTDLAYTSDGRLLLAGSSEGNISSFRTSDYRRQRRWPEREWFALWSHNELLLENPLELVSPYNGAKLRDLPELADTHTLLADGKLLATPGFNGELTLRRAQDGVVLGVAKVGNEIQDKEKLLERVHLSSDGSWLGAINAYHGLGFVWSLADISHPKLIRSLPDDDFVFLPDNRVAYSAYHDATEQMQVSVIDLRTGSPIGCLLGPRGETMEAPVHMAATLSGTWLAAATTFDKVYVWNLKELYPKLGPDAQPN